MIESINSLLVVTIPDSKLRVFILFIPNPAPVRFAEPVYANLPSIIMCLKWILGHSCISKLFHNKGYLSKLFLKLTPGSFSLAQNFPNPFNPTTIISYRLPVSSYVRLELFNVQGQLVETIESGRQEAGIHKIEWTASHLASGIYFYRLKAGNFTDLKKMILLK